QEYRPSRGFHRDHFPHYGMVPATVTGYEHASLGSGTGEGHEPSRWHFFLYSDLAFLGGDGHPFLVVPSPAVLDFGDLRGTGISNAVLPYKITVQNKRDASL